MVTSDAITIGDGRWGLIVFDPVAVVTFFLSWCNGAHGTSTSRQAMAVPVVVIMAIVGPMPIAYGCGNYGVYDLVYSGDGTRSSGRCWTL